MLLPSLAATAVLEAGEEDVEKASSSSGAGGTWTKKAPSSSPSARARHFMVYDPPTKKIVLFGGTSGGGETWVYDTAGDAWTQKNPSPSPGSRNAHAMAYDTKRNLVFMFGGTAGGDETWVYDATGDAWTNKNPSAKPTARTDAKVVYEPVTDRFLMFGGKAGSARTDEMWAYDPTNNSWMQLPIPQKPSARHRHAMVLDPVARKIVLQGGCIENNCASQFSDETWVLDPTAGGWTQKTPNPNPGQRDDHTLVFDAKNGRALTCCGYVGGTGHSNDVWSYDTAGDKWTDAGATGGPSPRYSYDWAWDASQGVAVLFGGQTSSGTIGDTWVYDPGGGGGTAPAVVSTNPANSATNVPVTTTIDITFSLAMDKAATEGAISSSPAVTGTFAWTAGDTKVTWTPGAPLQASTQYTVTVSTAAKSAQGVALPSNHVFSFTTAGGGVPPQVKSTVPPDGEPNFPVSSDIQITFSVAMARAETEGAVSASPAISGAFTWSAGDTVLTWNPGADLQPSVDYVVTVSTAAKSAAGTPLPAPFTFSFRTAAGPGPTPPSVTSTNPADQATSVPLNADVSVVFSEAMDQPATEGAFSISPTVPGTFSWNRLASDGGVASTMVFMHSQPFAASTKYTVTISTAAKSAAGANLANPKVFSFTTGTQSDTTPPIVSHIPPTNKVDEGTLIEIVATVTDAGGVGTVTLNYKTSASTSTITIGMSAGGGDEYKATIPASDVKPAKVDYYIEAKDKAGNVGRSPAGAPGTTHSIEVAKKDGGGTGGGPGAGGIFGMGALMDAVVFGMIIAIVIGALAAVMLMRRKKPAPAGQFGAYAPQGHGQQQWGPGGDQGQGQWGPPQGGQGWG
jgi:hypothetical protein